MPIPLEKSYVAPNAIYPSQIIFQSAVVNGQILTSAVITLQAAKVNVDGTWESAAGRAETVIIPDILNLPEDISSQSKQIQQIYGSIVELIGNMNAIRKVL